MPNKLPFSWLDFYLCLRSIGAQMMCNTHVLILTPASPWYLFKFSSCFCVTEKGFWCIFQYCGNHVRPSSDLTGSS